MSRMQLPTLPVRAASRHTAGMPRSSSASLVVVAAAAAGVLVGFLLGRGTGIAPGSGGPVDPTAGVSEPAAMRRIAELERDRDELRARLAAATPPHREAAPAPASAPDGMSQATSVAASSPSGEADPSDEVLDAEATLAALRDAIARGEAPAITGLQASVTANGEALGPDLVAMLDAADSLFATEQLANLLGELADPRALASLQAVLQREADDAVRTAVVRALGRIPDESSVVLLAAEFGRESTSPMPPSLAATSLGQIGSGAAIEALVREIENGNNGMVRAFALRSLAERNDPALVPFFFTQVMREGANDRSRKQAIEAIAATGVRSAIPGLEDLAFSSAQSRAIQESAKHAINRILGEVRYPVR